MSKGKKHRKDQTDLMEASPDTSSDVAQQVTPKGKKSKGVKGSGKKAKAAAAAPPPAEVTPMKRQCTAKSKQSGERCKRPPILGGMVCATHGGKAPQVQRTARGRLAELVMPAINTLSKEMEGARRSSDRQRAANSILDRAGITRGSNTETDAARALLLERLLTLRAEAGKPDPLILAAEVIEDAVVVDPPVAVIEEFDSVTEGDYDDEDDRDE